MCDISQVQSEPYLLLEVSDELFVLRGGPLGSGGALRWEVVVACGTVPSARAFHSSVVVGDAIIVLGGETGLPGPDIDYSAPPPLLFPRPPSIEPRPPPPPLPQTRHAFAPLRCAPRGAAAVSLTGRLSAQGRTCTC